MRVGEIWEYKGKFKPAKDGRRWTDDPDCCWYMDRVRLVNINQKSEKWGKMIAFEAEHGEPHPMEAVHTMPWEMFLKEYTKVYE